LLLSTWSLSGLKRLGPNRSALLSCPSAPDYKLEGALGSGVRSAIQTFLLCVQADSNWSEFIEEGGLLSQLTTEQEGDLGGPRVARTLMDDSADLADLAGGGLISGQEILQLLQGLQGLNV
jgi:hypothetical protein